MAKNAMIKAKKLLMALVLVEIIELVYGVVMNYSATVDAAAGMGDVAQSFAMGVLISAIVVALVHVALTIFLIKKADAEIETPNCGSAHVIIAWILLVATAFSAISGVATLFNAAGAMAMIGGLLQIAVDVFTVVVMWLYVRAVKALRA